MNPYSHATPQLWSASARREYLAEYARANDPALCCHKHKGCAAYPHGPCSKQVYAVQAEAHHCADCGNDGYGGFNCSQCGSYNIAMESQ